MSEPAPKWWQIPLACDHCKAVTYRRPRQHKRCEWCQGGTVKPVPGKLHG